MSTNPKVLLKNLYQALSDRPLEPEDPYYLAYMEDNDDEPDPVTRLQTEIEFSESQSLHMVSGQRGTGKSTELLRLKRNLENEGFVVFHIDMLDYIHTSEPIDISDFLLASTIALAEEAKNTYQLNHVYEGYWERLKNFLQSEIKLDEVTIKAGMEGFGGELKTRLKRDDSFKRKLQKASQGHINRLVEDANTFAVELVTELRKKQKNPDSQIVFIIDSFEQIRGNINNADEVHKSIVHLFSTHGKNLRFPMIHMVITVPPYLNTAAPGVASLLGATPPIVWPTIHTCKKSGGIDKKGISILSKIIAKRSPEINQIFHTEDLQRLAISSGGELRIMFSLVRSCLTLNAAAMNKMELPTPPDILQQAEDQQQRSMLPITDEDVEKLAFVHKSKQAELKDIEELPELARLFDFNLLMNYRNGDDWYDVHPLVLDYVLERYAVLQKRK